jgi:regulator of replication initiation timing
MSGVDFHQSEACKRIAELRENLKEYEDMQPIKALATYTEKIAELTEENKKLRTENKAIKKNYNDLAFKGLLEDE